MFDPDKCGGGLHGVPTEKRLAMQVDRSGGPDACWPFTGYCNKKGYGRIRHEGRKQLAHRVAFKLAGNELGDDDIAAHECDNPPCCNPKHVFKTTHQGNVDDRERKGRGVVPLPSFGDSHPNSMARQTRTGKCYVRQ